MHAVASFLQEQAERPGVASGACRTCGGATTRGYGLCLSCRAVALGLGQPLVTVTAIQSVGPASGLYRALRQYKSGEPEVAHRQERRLAAILERFGARHLAALAPGGLDLTVVVPSATGRRPPPHPLVRVVASTTSLPPYRDALAAGPGVVGHRKPARDAYRADPIVAGLRVLVVDDVYTSGAHLQSAAAALSEAGAATVAALVIGRYDRRAHPPRRSGGTAPGSRPGRSDTFEAGQGGRNRAGPTMHPPQNSFGTEESVSAPRGMGMGKGGRHLTDRYRNPRPWSTGNHTVRDLGAISSPGSPHTS